MNFNIEFSQGEMEDMVAESVRGKTRDLADVYVRQNLDMYNIRTMAQNEFDKSVSRLLPKFLEENKDDIVKYVARNLIDSMKFSNKDILYALLLAAEKEEK